MALRILIAPLNWGLGHATRCLPIAAAFAKTCPGAEIHWASDGQSLALLRAELPAGSPLHELPGYAVRYPTGSAAVNMLLSGPSVLHAIIREHQAIKELQHRFRYDLIISDNRYGCYLPEVRSVIISHQINLPLRNWFSRKLANALNHRLLARFDEIAVPDYPGDDRLAGAMSAPHPTRPTSYLGPVSRFAVSEKNSASGEVKPIDLLIVLSGPEPQRSNFEQKLLEQLPQLGNTSNHPQVLLVRGLPGAARQLVTNQLKPIIAAGVDVTAENFLTGAELEQRLRQTKALVCRPGYTTIMDLTAVRLSALVVPTPGQPEQAVLGQSWADAGRGICQEQADFDLLAGLRALKNLGAPNFTTPSPGNMIADWITKTLSAIAAN